MSKIIFPAAFAAAFAFAACNGSKSSDPDPEEITSDTTTTVTDTTVVDENNPPLGSDAKEIPFAGNTYVTSGKGIVNEDGIVGWASSTTVFSTYFKISFAGYLGLYLKYSVGESNNRIEVQCADKVFPVVLPKPKGSDTTIYIGKIDPCSRGYLRVDLAGKQRSGGTYASPIALVVNGPSSVSMNYVASNEGGMFYWGRRGPSVHMGYTLSSSVQAEWFYNEVTVPEGMDAVGSYFMVNGFKEGYFGIQVSETERRALFSVWSPFGTDDPSAVPDSLKVAIIKRGEGVTAQAFGGEGSGTQSFYDAQWKAGVTYKFLTRICPARDNGFSDYVASDYISYLYDPDKGWKLVAWLRRPGLTTYYKSPYSFLENFHGDYGHLTRKVYFSNQWVYTTKKEWVELVKGNFTVDGTGNSGVRKDYKGGLEDGKFFLQNCGFFDDNVTPNTPFTRPSGETPPVIEWETLEALLK